MARRILLMGAGFSRNWGGWLAKEVFEYLIGSAALHRHRDLRELLWSYQEPGRGGFEGLLADFQLAVAQDPSDPKPRAELLALETAISEMFADMNAALLHEGSSLFNSRMCDFLAGFNVIFSLNQDLLLERHYIFSDSFPAKKAPHKWSGASLPGIEPDNGFQPRHQDRGAWIRSRWKVVQDNPQFGKAQPVVKLHGSAQWFRPGDESGLMIIGGNKKEAIERDPLLKSYRAHFHRELQVPGTRLMIVGYGFGDAHINEQIVLAAENGTKTFVSDARGAEAFAEADVRTRGYMQRSLIGVSRRPISELTNPSEIENAKLRRFMEDNEM
ncbi:MAG: hypothetical protein ABMA14_15455 [Hyphomonadaceae bacterium]